MIVKASNFLKESLNENKKLDLNLKETYSNYIHEVTVKLLKDIEDFFKKHNMKFNYSKTNMYGAELSYYSFDVDGVPLRFSHSGYSIGFDSKKIENELNIKNVKGMYKKYVVLKNIVPVIKEIKEKLRNTNTHTSTKDFFETL